VQWSSSRITCDDVLIVCERTIPTERPPLVGEVVPTFACRGCRVVSVTDPQGCILGFLHYYFFQAAPQLYSKGWVDPVPDPLLLRKSGSGNRTWNLWICSQELWPLDHRGSLIQPKYVAKCIWVLDYVFNQYFKIILHICIYQVWIQCIVLRLFLKPCLWMFHLEFV
jgi:hypothetical protein